MIVVSQFLKLHNVCCGDTVLQNKASSSNIFAVLDHWIPERTNSHAFAMAEKK